MTEKFEIVRTGVVVAFDADTGEPLLVNEIYEEVTPNTQTYSRDPIDTDRTFVEAEARRLHGSRNIDILAVASGDLEMSEDVPVEWSVDIQARKLVQREAPIQQLPRTDC